MKVRLEFKPRNLWVGVFWKRQYVHEPNDRNRAVLTTREPMEIYGHTSRSRQYDVYVCLLPCLPLRFTWSRPL